VAAGKAGVVVPATEPASEEALASLDGPAIVKARLHVQLGTGVRPPRLDTVMASTRPRRRRGPAEIRMAGGEPLLQELVPGSLVEVALIADGDGALLVEVHQVAELG